MLGLKWIYVSKRGSRKQEPACFSWLISCLHINGSMQKRRNSSAVAMELRLFCIFFVTNRNTILVHRIYNSYIACFWRKDGQGSIAHQVSRWYWPSFVKYYSIATSRCLNHGCLGTNKGQQAKSLCLNQPWLIVNRLSPKGVNRVKFEWKSNFAFDKMCWRVLFATSSHVCSWFIMMTSWQENGLTLLKLCEGNPQVNDGFPLRGVYTYMGDGGAVSQWYYVNSPAPTVLPCLYLYIHGSQAVPPLVVSEGSHSFRVAAVKMGSGTICPRRGSGSCPTAMHVSTDSMVSASSFQLPTCYRPATA